MISADMEVMMVEDDEFTRQTIKQALLAQSVNVVFDTSNVKDALDWAKSNHPDIAVLDYNLGVGPNGIDLANSLRKFLPEIGIVLLTAFLDPVHLREKMSMLPQGSRYLIKYDVTRIEVLIEEIERSKIAK